MSTRTFVTSIEGEFQRYKALAEGALAQLSDDEVGRPAAGGGNSVATIVWHLSGNFSSRFSDFLTTDGEKPWRRREEEFLERHVPRQELVEKWESGWRVLFGTLAALADEDLTRTVMIRGQAHQVHEALHRSLAHAAYHVGQIVYAAKGLRGSAWSYLSIPPGQSDAYNQSPSRERASEHADAVRGRR